MEAEQVVRADVREEPHHRLGLGLEEAATAVIAVTTEKMVSAIGDVTVNQGIDPDEQRAADHLITIDARATQLIAATDRVRAYLNACPHRGTVLCRETEGNAKTFQQSQAALVAYGDKLLPIPWLRGKDGRLQLVLDWRDPAVKPSRMPASTASTNAST